MQQIDAQFVCLLQPSLDGVEQSQCSDDKSFIKYTDSGRYLSGPEIVWSETLPLSKESVLSGASADCVEYTDLFINETKLPKDNGHSKSLINLEPKEPEQHPLRHHRLISSSWSGSKRFRPKPVVQEETEAPNPEKEVEDLEGRDCVWNVNMFSVLSWKSVYRTVLAGAVSEKDGEKTTLIVRVSASVPIYLFRIVPFGIAFIQVLILIGILDEGAKIKTLIDHDVLFRLPMFNWAKTTTDCDPNLVMKAWLQDQNRPEASNCLFYGRRMQNFSRSVKFSNPDFFNEYFNSTSSEFSSDLEWMLSHCFPWAYADVCINLMSEGVGLDSEGVGGCDQPSGARTCSFRNCYMPNGLSTAFGGKHRVSVQDWEDVLVPIDEVDNLINLSQPIGDSINFQQQTILQSRFLAAYEESKTRSVYAERSDFICWFMQNMVNKRKTFKSTSNNLSLYLYQKLHYVYVLGVGDSHLLELSTIVVLSLYVYFTAIFDELTQMFYQVYACSELSSYDDVLLGLGLRSENANNTSNLSNPKQLSFWIKYVQLMLHNVMCDVFISFRMIYIACMCQATVMIIAWDHGVMEVVFASLAITFLLEVDDKLMNTLCEKLEFNLVHRKVVVGFQDVLRDRILADEDQEESLQYLSKPKILRIGAFCLLSALAGLHLYQTLTLATMNGLKNEEDPQQEAQNVLNFFVVLQSRFLPLSAGIAGAAMLCNFFILGPYSFVNSVSLGLCLGWIMQAVYSGLNNGVLFDAWGMHEVGVTVETVAEVGESVQQGMTSGFAWGIEVFLPLHVLWSLLWPGLVLFWKLHKKKTL